MFNLFRSREKSVRYLLGAMLFVISLSMLLYLIPGGGPGGSSIANQNVVASVGDQKITVGEVQNALERMMGSQPNFPRALLAAYVPMVVNQYVDMYAKAYEAKRLGLSITDEELGNEIERMMSQQMGGKFDKNLYAAMIQQRGDTVPQFENFYRTNMLASRYDAVTAQSLIVTDEEAKREYQRENEKVALRFLQLSEKDFTNKVDKDPAKVKAWFTKHQSEFRTPEKRSFDLVVGSDLDFVQSAKVSDDELRRRYQDNIDSYRTPERVHARHILIKTTGVPKDQTSKLRQKADDLLKQLKGGANFAELAKKNSDDPGSAQKGGDLGWIVKGQTVPDFEKAAFSLKPNELSGVITTEYGFHVIQVLEHQQARVESFDEAKSQLLAEAQKEIGDQNMQKAVANARDETARNPSQAEAVAKKHGLKYFKVDQATSSATLPDLNSQADVSSAIFNTPKGGVTQVVPLDSVGKAAYGVVTNIFASRPATFEEVQKEATDRYASEEAKRLLADAAKQAAQRAKGEDLEKIAKALGGEVKNAAAFTMMGAAEGIGPASNLSQAFAAETKVGDTFGPVEVSGSQYICKVTEKQPTDMSKFASNRDTVIQSLRQKKSETQGVLFTDSIVTDLKKRGLVKLNEQAIQRLSATYRS